MGRKKKKSGASYAKDGGPRAVAQENTASNHDESLKAATPEDWLGVRLVQPQSTSSVRDFQKEHLVYLTEQDAYRIDVIDGDLALLLARDETETVVASAVCSVRIAVDGATPNKITSPGGKGTPGRQPVRLLQGNCRVSPVSLATFLCMSDDGSSESVMAPSPEPVSTSSSTHVTPSKSPFSFAKGGGGDALISPSSSVTTKSPQTPLRSSSSRSIWVVPLHCSLGERMLNMLCSDALRVSLRLSSDVDGVAWSKSHRVLQRLVLAYHAGRFIHEGDSIGISFQGKPLKLKVESVCMHDESIRELSKQVSGIDLDSSSDGDTIMEAVCGGLQNVDRKQRVHLYKLTCSTEIVLVNGSESGTKDTLQEYKDDDSSEATCRVVAGLDSTLEQVKALLLPPLLRSDLFKNHFLRPPRGVLLHGPSGVGKSLLAQQIKLDLQSHVYVRSINCTSLQSRTAIVGEAERYLSRLFESVRQQHDKPGALLILDDIHLICPKRGGKNQVADRLAATLLALLDGIGASVGVKDRGNLMILGITSNPSLLDPALRRPGRLDSEVEVPIPDEVSRAEILKFKMDRLGPSVTVPQMEDSDYMTLSRLAKGFNGADVMLAIKEALRKAIGESSDLETISMTRSHLEASIRATKPSTISSITVEIPQVYWASIGGMESVKQKLRESIELPVTHAHLFEALNIPPPRGVLLYGPPGCSKTLMARALATEGQMNFLAVKGPELLSKWLGESERALASLFRRARMASPCIIFFDEIDAIASKRGGGGGGSGGERLLSQLLTELDGVSSSTATLGSGKKERVVVVGATNRPDLLDSALTRPGRIDRMIYVGLPDQSSRARIFEIGLKGKGCSDDVEVTRIASVTTSVLQLHVTYNFILPSVFCLGK